VKRKVHECKLSDVNIASVKDSKQDFVKLIFTHTAYYDFEGMKLKIEHTFRSNTAQSIYVCTYIHT